MPSSNGELGASVLARVRASIECEHLFGRRASVLVAVSGGADSLCLLDCLARLGRSVARRLTVGHVDHGFRAASAADAAFVQATTEARGLDCTIVTVDGPGYMRTYRVGMEAAARALRYRALGMMAAERGASVVATGHTRDDSVESVLLHLIRGSGLAGLGGISPVEWLDLRMLGPGDEGGMQPLTIVRPLLNVTRSETAGYCLARGLAWRTDPTNADTRLLRNRVRQHLLPVLRTYNPAIDTVLGRMARVLRDDEQVLHHLAAQKQARLVSIDDGTARVSLAAWLRQPIGVQRRLAKRLVEQLRPGIEIGADAIERIRAVAQTGGPARAGLAGGLEVRRHGAELRIGQDRAHSARADGEGDGGR
ncbi:MAG: tRNA lysidine(34) synthetase TilS [Chloroflexi bacterium]|nr:tRNA lysidine(34) synthetase TilS [Chloroflexota bacterium]